MISMKHFKTTGAVLKSRPLGESDRLVTLLTWEKGKIGAVAKGARKTKSKLAAGVDLFVYGNYVLYEGKNLATITQQEILETFNHLHHQPEGFAYASYFAELVEKILMEGEKNVPVSNLLLDGWRALAEVKDYNLLARAFEIKLLSDSGYHPYFGGCINCGSQGREYFSGRMGGLVCNKCVAIDSMAISFAPGTVSLVNYFLTRDLTETDVIKASSGQKSELYAFTTGLMEHYLDVRECKSLQYIKQYFSGSSRKLS